MRGGKGCTSEGIETAQNNETYREGEAETLGAFPSSF